MGRERTLWLAKIMMLGVTLHLMVLLVRVLNASAVFICRKVRLQNHIARSSIKPGD